MNTTPRTLNLDIPVNNYQSQFYTSEADKLMKKLKAEQDLKNYRDSLKKPIFNLKRIPTKEEKKQIKKQETKRQQEEVKALNKVFKEKTKRQRQPKKKQEPVKKQIKTPEEKINIIKNITEDIKNSNEIKDYYKIDISLFPAYTSKNEDTEGDKKKNDVDKDASIFPYSINKKDITGDIIYNYFYNIYKKYKDTDVIFIYTSNNYNINNEEKERLKKNYKEVNISYKKAQRGLIKANKIIDNIEKIKFEGRKEKYFKALSDKKIYEIIIEDEKDFLDNIQYKKNNIIISQKINLSKEINFSKWWKQFSKFGALIFDSTSETTTYNSDFISTIPEENIKIEYGVNVELEGEILIYPIKPTIKENLKIIKQNFKEHTFSNCLLEPIKQWANNCKNTALSKSSFFRYKKIEEKINKYIDKYLESGVPQDDINDICNDLQIDIEISLPLQKEHKILECKSSKKALKKFTFINTKFNHIEHNELILQNNFIETYIDNEGIKQIMTSNELLNIKSKLDENDEFYMYKRNKQDITSIITLKGNYRCINEYSVIVQDFEKNTGLNHCKICDFNDKEISEFVRDGCHYNLSLNFVNEIRTDINESYINYSIYNEYINEINEIINYDLLYILYFEEFKKINYPKKQKEFINGIYNPEYIKCKYENYLLKTLNPSYKETYNYLKNKSFLNNNYKIKEEKCIKDICHIDMSKAYANFKSCNYYDGFLGKITDFRKTNKIMGVGMYQIENIDFSNVEEKIKKILLKLNVYHNKYIYSSPELKFLEDNKVKFEIISGAWGHSPLDFEFNDDMLNKKDNGVSYYAKWCGASNSFYTSDNYYLKSCKNFADILKYNSNEYDNITHISQTDETMISINKKNSFHLSHITAFILSYQRLNMIEQLKEINYNDIIKINVDCVYYYKSNNEITLKNVFRHKEFKECILNSCGNSFIPYEKDEPIRDYKYSNIEVDNNYKSKINLGCGGSGKTTKELRDDGLIKKLFCPPSWKLARNKEKEENVSVSVWHYITTKDTEILDKILKKYNVLIIDEASMMTEETKKFILEKFKLCKIIFCGDLGYQLPPIEGEEMTIEGIEKVEYFNSNYRCKCALLLELLNKCRDMINKQYSLYEINSYIINFFKNNNRIIKKKELIKIYDINDMILSSTNKIKDEYTDLFKDKFDMKKIYITSNNRHYSNGEILITNEEIKGVSSQERYCYTTHSIQGETAYDKLFIDINQIFDVRMFYTALSRAMYLDQIYLISN